MKSRAPLLAMILALLCICGFNTLVGFADAEGSAPIGTSSPAPENTTTPKPSTLAKGSKGEEVSALQARLVFLGFTDEQPDGYYGQRTAAVVNLAKSCLNLTQNGKADGDFRLMLEDDEQMLAPVLSASSKGTQVLRVQRRLRELGYLSEVDGVFGAGTRAAVRSFQERNRLEVTDTADRSTQMILFSNDAKFTDAPEHPYKIVIDVSDQICTVYGWSNDNGYTTVLHEMKCSTGTGRTPTPLGVYTKTVKKGERWHYFKRYNVWAQYIVHLDRTGNIMIHSVLSKTKGAEPTDISVNNLGSRASHGCVRLSVEDASWIWENCENGTTVVVQQ